MRNRWPVLLLVALIGYGSVFPFDYVAHQPRFADVLHLLTDWPRRLSASDVVGNVLLFLPLGLMIPTLSGRWRGRLGWTFAAILFAWLLQYVQFWYPSRDPSGSDAAFNTLGIAIGLVVAIVAERLIEARHFQFARSSPQWRVAAALMLCWLAYRWFPWVPSLDVDNLKHGIGPLFRNISLDAPRVLHDAAAWLLWFWLAGHGPIERPAAGRIAAGCGVLIVLAEPMFVGNSVTLSNLLGLAAAIALRPRLAAPSSGSGSEWALVALLGASLAISGLAPFSFTATNRFYWLPFAGMLSGSMVVNTASLIEKSYLYGGAVLLLCHLHVRWWLAGMLVAAELAWIESMQVALPGRIAEITDPVLALLLALAIKAALGSKARSNPEAPWAAAPASGNDFQAKSS